MSETIISPSKPRRRRFTLSLCVLMLLVLVVGGLLGWKVRRASTQRRAVAAIKESGGAIWYDFMWQGKKVVTGASPWAPRWLREAIGDEFFQEPRTVFLDHNAAPGGVQATDATIDAVASLDRVEDLNSYKVPITDAGFAKLAAMPRLKSFCLLDTSVTDAGLAPVESFPALETLRLRVKPPGALSARALELVAHQPRLKFLELLNINLPDPTSLAPLAKLTRLEYLRLWRSPQDDSCMEPLRGLATLKTLDLRETRLTDSGVDRLSGMDALESVLFDGTKLTDVGLAGLAAHASLKRIYLTPAPNISDASLALLGKLDSIEELYLTRSNVTDAGLDRLKGLKLNCLGVSGPGVTDAGLASLSGQAGLRSLTLDKAKVDDAGAAILATLPSLEILVLSENPLTDAGLLALVQAAPRLRYLDVRGTNVTARGLAAAAKLKPGLTVQSSPWLKIRENLNRLLPFGPRK